MKVTKRLTAMRKSSSSQGSPRSSTSPSLAGTRSKRSLKIPARFHDTEFAFRDVAEALRMKGNREPKDDDAARATLEDFERSKDVSSSSSSAATTPASTPAPSTTPTIGLQNPTISPPAAPRAAPSVKQTSQAVRRENEDNVREEVPVKVLKGAFRPSVTYKKQSVSFSTESSSENVGTQVSTRPLVEHIPNTEPPASKITGPAPTLNAPNSRHSSSNRKRPSSSKKKSVSQQAASEAENQTQSFSLPLSGAGTINNITIQPPQQNHKSQLQQLLQQPTSQNVYHQPRPIQVSQYGTRLLPMDQPIYLPISVGNIAPITATMPLIANMARRPPFVSQKAATCLEYQDSLKMSSILSTHKALVRVTRHLGVKDRLALRAASKTWKSIIDSEAVWKRVLVTSADLETGHLHWDTPVKRYFNRYKTTDLIIQEMDFPLLYAIIKYSCEEMTHLRRIWLRSIGMDQNLIVYKALFTIEEILIKSLQREENGVESFLSHGEIRWQVKVGIDSLGLATVNLLKPPAKTYSRPRASEPSSDQADVEIELELNDLRAEFDWAQRLNQPADKVAKVVISPI